VFVKVFGFKEFESIGDSMYLMPRKFMFVKLT